MKQWLDSDHESRLLKMVAPDGGADRAMAVVKLDLERAAPQEGEFHREAQHRGWMMYPSVSKRRTVLPCQVLATSRPRRKIGLCGTDCRWKLASPLRTSFRTWRCSMITSTPATAGHDGRGLVGSGDLSRPRLPLRGRASGDTARNGARRLPRPMGSHGRIELAATRYR